VREAAIIFDMLFEGKRDAYAVQKPDGSLECIRNERGITQIEKHLSGEQALAVYPVDGERCWFACLDVDCADDPEEAVETAAKVQKILKEVNVEAWLEKSKSKGAHVWVFFAEAFVAYL